MTKIRKRPKKELLSPVDKIVSELQSNVIARRFDEKNTATATSLLTHFISRDQLTFKQVELAKMLNARVKVLIKTRQVSDKKYYLYAMTDGTDVKLGISTNIPNRLKQIQTSSSTNIKILWRYYVGKNKQISFNQEKKLHRVCKAHRLKREWFSIECMDLVKSFKPKI